MTNALNQLLGGHHRFRSHQSRISRLPPNSALTMPGQTPGADSGRPRILKGSGTSLGRMPSANRTAQKTEGTTECKQLCKQRGRIPLNGSEPLWTIVPGRALVAADAEPSRTPRM
jgi:hypothetical protein